jgi:hypothetical protein
VAQDVKPVSDPCNVLTWLSLAVAIADVLVRALRLWIDTRRKQTVDDVTQSGQDRHDI